MSTAIVKQVINKFLRAPETRVLAISGEWGVGKTFTIDKIIKSCSDEDATDVLPKFSYVSVFGLNSMTELRTKIWASTQPFPFSTGKQLNLRRIANSEWVYKARSFARDYAPSLGKSVVIGIETIVSNLLKDTIIWLDDVERLGPGIKMEDFMGLVSELKEQLGCKVIIVYNASRLGNNKTVFSKYAEKVIDQKLSFEISAKDAIEFGLSKDTKLRDQVIPFIAALKVKNIRVVHRISYALDFIYPEVAKNSAHVKERAARAAAIFTIAQFEGARGFPSPRKVITFNAYERETSHKIAEEAAAAAGITLEEAVNWREMFAECSFTRSDQLDAEIMKAIEQGYAENTEIKVAANAIDASIANDHRTTKFAATWSKFHHRLDMTPTQLADEFNDAIRAAPTHISPMNMNSTVQLLRQIGHGTIADTLIDLYVQAFGSNVELFHPQNRFLYSGTVDPTFDVKMKEALIQHKKIMTLEQAIQLRLVEGRSSDDADDVLLAATSAQIFDALHIHQGENLIHIITRFPKMRTEKGFEVMAANLEKALQKIASISPLHAYQVNRWLDS